MARKHLKLVLTSAENVVNAIGTSLIDKARRKKKAEIRLPSLRQRALDVVNQDKLWTFEELNIPEDEEL